jgi:hypothetical protein
MTYMRSWKSHRLTSHTWLGLNPQIGRPLSRIVGGIVLMFHKLTLLKDRQKMIDFQQNLDLPKKSNHKQCT